MLLVLSIKGLTEDYEEDGNEKQIEWRNMSHGMVGENCRFINITFIESKIYAESPNDCYRKCIERNKCTNFNYLKKSKNCFLANGNKSRSDATISSYDSYCGLVGKRKKLLRSGKTF